MILRFMTAAALVLLSANGLAATTLSTATQRDIAGIRLGMTVEEAAPLMVKFCGKPLRGDWMSSDKHILTGTNVPRVNGCVNSDNLHLKVWTALKIPVDKQQTSIVWKVELSGPSTKGYAEELQAAALKKYGPPDFNSAGERWCVRIKTKFVNVDNIDCDRSAPILERYDGKLVLFSEAYVKAEKEASAAAKNTNERRIKPSF